MEKRANLRTAAAALVLAALLLPGTAGAHCDAVDGPVVTEARAALEKGDVTPVLKWVRPEDEGTIREVFAQAAAVRTLGPEARSLADGHFFETLVRVHRAAEGAPYTGLKPAGRIEPAVVKADQALAGGSVDELAKAVGRHAEEGIRERFARAAEARKHAGENVAAGREYVDAYVTYIHYVEGVVDAVHQESAHAEASGHAH